MTARAITRDELRTWLDQRCAFVLIDTGLAEDFSVEHLPGAQSACVFEVNFLDQVRALSGWSVGDSRLDTPVVVYGASERSLASSTAAEKLLESGFRTVWNFRGGLAAWRGAGWTTEGSGQALGLPPLEDRAYVVDAEQSSLEWTGRSLGGKHQGTLTLLPGGTITLHAGQAMSGQFGIDMTSIQDADLTDSALKQVLHAHLASDDFFDVAKYPQAAFQLESATVLAGATPGEPNYTVHGNLLLKGVTNPLAFPAMISRSPAGDGSLVARANFEFDRTRWNVLYGSGKFYEKLGRHLVSDLITVDLKIVAR